MCGNVFLHLQRKICKPQYPCSFSICSVGTLHLPSSDFDTVLLNCAPFKDCWVTPANKLTWLMWKDTTAYLHVQEAQSNIKLNLGSSQSFVTKYSCFLLLETRLIRVLRQGTFLLTPGNLIAHFNRIKISERLKCYKIKLFGSFSCSMQIFWLTLALRLLLDAETTFIFFLPWLAWIVSDDQK